MDIVLVGVVAPGIENHSLDALRAALDAEGVKSCVVPFGGFAAIDRMLGDVLRWAPRICGVSLQTTESTLAVLTFTRLLRARGFAGQIVVGGHVATLMPDELLAAPAGIDVVVELAGEAALVGLARGADPRTLPGTRTRAGHGHPPIAVRPRAIPRPRLSEHLGFGAADLILSRGCAASCGYCCIAAVSTRAESAGASRHVVREVDELADEIAGVAVQGARAFHIMDDNVLPLDPAQALGWAHALGAALARRAVPPIAFSLQLRADVITPALAAALVDLGLVRAYIGIDGYSAPQLRALGRHAPATAGQLAIDELSRRGVFCVANALLVGPTIRFETVAGEIEALAAVRGAPVHLLPIEARPGTVYHRRATARGLIEGGPLWPTYRFEDERTFRIGEVITRLPTRLEERSVPIALYDLAWALGVARRLVPGAVVATAGDTYARVTEAWNADQIRILRLAAATTTLDDVEALLARETPIVRAHDEALLAACDRALVDVERAVSAVRARPVRAHVRGRILSNVALAMSLAAACGGRSRPEPVADATVDVALEVDAPLPACVDPDRESESRVSDTFGCECSPGFTTFVRLSFDPGGNVTAITGDTEPLAPELEQCLLDLLAGYCYPTLAGTTQRLMTCHGWIA